MYKLQTFSPEKEPLWSKDYVICKMENGQLHDDTDEHDMYSSYIFDCLIMLDTSVICPFAMCV